MLEWLTAGKTTEYMRRHAVASPRRLRLFACAVARHGGCGSWASVGHLMAAAEAIADGASHGLTARDLELAQPFVAAWLVGGDAAEAARRVLDHYGPEDREAGPAQAGLLRCVVGDPWRPVVLPWGSAEPVWENGRLKRLERHCSWLTPTALALANAAYDLRRPDGTLDPHRLLVLADALEESGCPQEQCRACGGKGWHPGDMGCRACGATTPGTVGTGRMPHSILAHLRSAGSHVRGCWSLDCVLGKE